MFVSCQVLLIPLIRFDGTLTSFFMSASQLTEKGEAVTEGRLSEFYA